jgi:hypothetical protein
VVVILKLLPTQPQRLVRGRDKQTLVVVVVVPLH